MMIELNDIERFWDRVCTIIKRTSRKRSYCTVYHHFKGLQLLLGCEWRRC